MFEEVTDVIIEVAGVNQTFFRKIQIVDLVSIVRSNNDIGEKKRMLWNSSEPKAIESTGCVEYSFIDDPQDIQSSTESWSEALDQLEEEGR